MRITDLMKNNQLVRNTTRHQMQFDEVQNQLATGQRIRRPADDPAAATNQMFFRTRVNELDQFDRNLTDAKSRLDLIDGQLAGVTDIMQRVRVLSVQASNGIYQGDNHFELRQAIAKEIDQHLRQMVELANGRDSTGRALFGGHVVERLPFETVQGNVEGLQGLELENVITAVRYRGDIGKQLREVERDQYLDVNLPGNKVFWGTNMTVTGTVDNSAYQA
ncbi:MAG: flagellar hook-associated protein FlgL, partial [Leptospiraceae bacterium]|nr:flagellar hook-associated protein FlgL [Leptospiraceae bacterium]